MLINTKIVLVLHRSLIQGNIVTLGKKPKIIKTFQAAWTIDTLDQVLTAMLTKLQTKKVLLLLGDDVSYVLQVTLAAAIEPKNLRQVIWEKITTQVPETFSDNEWDYKLLESKSEPTAIAFVPVLAIYRQMSDALLSQEVEVIAVEPEAIAQMAHPDPVIGMALKKDISGKDSSTLTIGLAGSPAVVDKEESKKSPALAEFSKQRFTSVLSLELLLVLLALILGSIVAWRIVANSKIGNQPNLTSTISLEKIERS